VPRAGLTPATVTEAGAALADEIGFAQLSMGLLAERLGVKTPSLYKHVDSLADLAHRIAVLAMTELGDAIRDATQGRADSDALAAAAQAMRTYVKEHPGRYAAGNGARPTGPDDPLIPASDRLLGSLAAVLRGYRMDPSQEIHALRMLRSMLHGFATLEVAGGFQIDTDVDDSFTWMINLIDQGLQATTATRTRSAPPADTQRRRPDTA
jgi:AcrR family transcriptional regulator